MSNVNLADFQQLYLSTAFDYLKKMEELSNNLSTSLDKNALEEIHRSAHSLKSQSLVMGYQTTGELSHVLEVFFRRVIEESGQITDSQIAVVNEAVQQLKESLNMIKAETKEIDLSSVILSTKNSLGVNL